jgi:hypothetical protein
VAEVTAARAEAERLRRRVAARELAAAGHERGAADLARARERITELEVQVGNLATALAGLSTGGLPDRAGSTS